MNNLNLKKISAELFTLALPMAFTQLITVASGFISMAMISSLGHDVLAASALIFSSRISILIIGSSILFALSILIGHAYGEKQYLRIGNFVQQGWTWGLLISIPMMLTFWNIDAILVYFGQPKAIAAITQQFFHTNIWNVLPFLLSVCNQQLLYGTRKQKFDMLANIIGIFVLLFSAYSLIFGHFYFPKLGVAGLGYALDMQGWFYFIFTTSVLYFHPFFQRFNLFMFRIHESWKDLKLMLTMGWPICVQIGGEMLSLFFTAAMVGWLGINSLAAYQIISQYSFLIIVPLFSLSQATGILVGQSFGEKNITKLNKIGHAGVIFSCSLSLVIALIFIGFPKQLAALYLNINDPKNFTTLHLVSMLFFICAFQQLFDGVRNVLTGALRGLFDTKFPMIIGLLTIWIIGIPLGYALAFHFSFGVTGILIGSTVGMLLGMAVLIFRWHKLNRKLLMKLI